MRVCNRNSKPGFIGSVNKAIKLPADRIDPEIRIKKYVASTGTTGPGL